MDKQLYFIGAAHIDPVWLWRLPEGLSEIKATFRSALDRMKEFPDYIFTSACASYYAWIEENEPAMFAEIRERIAEGRWQIAGGMWVQPDCNLPCGESFARQLLYSQLYFREKFGTIARVGYNVDSFGHNGMLPQLLHKAGMDGYVYERPNGRDEMPEQEEDTFRWRSPDGSEILAHRIASHYSGDEDGAPHIDLLAERYARYKTPYMGFYGVGNHGGGPTIAVLERLEACLAEHPEYCYGSPEAFFRDVRQRDIPQRLTCHEGDLQHHASGAYAAGAPMKKLNRLAESALTDAEKASALRSWLMPEKAVPDCDLQKAWKRLLFNQFHDILAGCCIREAAEDAERAFGGVITEAEEQLNFQLQKISWSINTHKTDSPIPAQKRKKQRFWEKAGEGMPLVVFNMNGFSLRTPIFIGYKRITAISDENNRFLPMQIVRGPQTNRDNVESVIFEGEVPPYSYRTFYMWRSEDVPSVPVENAPEAEGNILENQYLRVEFDTASGFISSITDKTSGKVHSGPMAAAEVLDDSANDTWSHGVFSFCNTIGRFGNAVLSVKENGPVRAVIRIISTFEGCRLVQEFSLDRHARAVEVSAVIFMARPLTEVRLTFRTDRANCKAVYAMPFGFTEKVPDGKENPAQCWAALTGRDGGIGVVSDAKYSFSAEPHCLGMIAARTCCYADHFGQRDDLMEYQELGEQRFRYYIYPHDTFRGNDFARFAAALHHPLRSIPETFHSGPLSPCASAFSATAENILPESVKAAEDGRGIIARLYETAGRETTCNVTLFGNTATLHFKPQEVLTVRFYGGKARLCSLLEDAL